MKEFKLKLTAIITALVMLISFAPFAYSEENIPESVLSGEEAAEFIENAAALAALKYKFEADKKDLYLGALKKILTDNPELLDSALKGMFDSLDDYSVYYTQEELDSFLEHLEGEFCGIGVLVTADNAGLIVSKVYDDTPAMDGGLAQGDIITHVGDVYLGGMDINLAQQYILGEEYTPVTLTISRNGKSFVKTLVRRKVIIESGFYQTVENDSIGYIRLDDFNDSACEFIKKALKEFDKKNIRDIIFDIRSNPGGGLNELVDVCSLFIPSGPAIHLEYKNPLNFHTLYAENKNETPKYNLAVLIDSNSASASEAFSAAVQDTGVGIVIGEKSFGKGTMQNITRLKIGGGVKLTEAEYLSPNMRKVNGVGVTPDVSAPDGVKIYENSDLTPMSYERVLKTGDKGSDVLAIEERLRILGLSVGIPDEIYDYQTHLAVMSFQKATELYPYGVMDFTTQAKLDSILMGQEIRGDNSYKKAVEIFKVGNWQDYKLDWSNK